MIDTANLSEIKEAASWGVISGVTTNPSLIAKEGGDFKTAIQGICKLVDGPISAEVIASDAQGMISEGKGYAQWHKNVVIKVPMTEEGIRACAALSKEGIRVNVTLVFTPNQALLAARAGAFLVSPFVGRLDDIGENGMQVVKDIVEIYRKHDLKTHVLAASIRNPVHVAYAAKAGADYATIPFVVLKQMFRHPLTDAGIKRFLEDWEKAKKQ